MALSDDGSDVVGKKIKEECDCLGISGGWSPRVHLFTQSGGKLKFRDEDNVFLPDKSELDQISIGSCNGDFEIDEVIKNSLNSIVDIRYKTSSLIVKQAEKLGIKIHWKSTVINTNGYKKINSIEIMKLSEDSTGVIGKKLKEECDCLGISGGWTPRVN